MDYYPPTTVERAMRVQEVMLQAMSGKLKWLEAADVLGIQPRTIRHWKWKLEHQGMNALLDRRCRVPSPRRVPGTEVEAILRLYRERYLGFNVRHFHERAVRDHGVTRSYTFVKHVLQAAGLIRKHRTRGKHRLRRERRACFGEMLHLDGSRHPWLALVPEQRQSLIAVADDATSRLLYAQLWPAETRTAVFHALRAVFQHYGLPQQLYSDRAGWATRVPKAGQRGDPQHPTQLQRALEALGIEQILAFSPQARGRSERLNRTLQGRLVNELRLVGIRTAEEANRYLEQTFLPDYNARFARPPADPASGFVALGNVDLDQYLCVEGRRRVNRDNTVVLGKTVLQIPKQPGRRSCERRLVLVRHHLQGGYSIHLGSRLLGRYDRLGRLRTPPTPLRLVPAERQSHLSKPGGKITC
ncbi:MAG: ISNCY family transposase [candidate division Zixibacteria bacterium]|nr:ISNCY family transposase [candidate division Zixibacteria bacterium]